jgi:hypothetical protein
MTSPHRSNRHTNGEEVPSNERSKILDLYDLKRATEVTISLCSSRLIGRKWMKYKTNIITALLGSKCIDQIRIIYSSQSTAQSKFQLPRSTQDPFFQKCQIIFRLWNPNILTRNIDLTRSSWTEFKDSKIWKRIMAWMFIIHKNKMK